MLNTDLQALEAPPFTLFATEPVRAVLDLCASYLRPLPPSDGDGHPVLVIPGFTSSDSTTHRFRKIIKRCGFEAHAWGLGTNRGPCGEFDSWLDSLQARLQTLYEKEERRVSLVGWSLGGIYARELAKRAPYWVRQVVTVATPFRNLNANYLVNVARYLNKECPQVTPELQQRFAANPPVPTTSLYSKSDGVVAWQACVADETPWSQNIDIPGASHWAIATHPQVMRIIMDRLSQPEARWRHYQPAVDTPLQTNQVLARVERA